MTQAAPALPGKPLTRRDLAWSDVIAYWRDLEQRGHYDLLAVERYWLHRRRWDGDGMAVDVAALERWMDACMERRLHLELAGGGVVR